MGREIETVFFVTKAIKKNSIYSQYVDLFTNYINEEFGDEPDVDDIISDLSEHNNCNLYNLTKNKEFINYVKQTIKHTNEKIINQTQRMSNNLNKNRILIKSNINHIILGEMYNYGIIKQTFIIKYNVNNIKDGILCVGIDSQNFNIDYDIHGEIYINNICTKIVSKLEYEDKIDIILNFNKHIALFIVNNNVELEIELNPDKYYSFSYKFSKNIHDECKEPPIDVDKLEIKNDTYIPIKLKEYNVPEIITNNDNNIKKDRYNIESPLVIVCCESQDDTDLCKELFDEKFGYYLMTNNDILTKIALINFMTKCQEFYKKNKEIFDSVIMIISMKGEYDVIITNDNKRIETSILIDMFKDTNNPTILFKDSHSLILPDETCSYNMYNCIVFEAVYIKINIEKYGKLISLIYQSFVKSSNNHNNIQFMKQFCKNDNIIINIGCTYNIYFMFNKDTIIRRFQLKIKNIKQLNSQYDQQIKNLELQLQNRIIKHQPNKPIIIPNINNNNTKWFGMYHNRWIDNTKIVKYGDINKITFNQKNIIYIKDHTYMLNKISQIFPSWKHIIYKKTKRNYCRPIEKLIQDIYKLVPIIKMDKYGNKICQIIKYGDKIVKFIYNKYDNNHSTIQHRLSEIIEVTNINEFNNIEPFILDKPLSNIAIWYKNFEFKFPNSFRSYKSETKKTLEILKNKDNIVGIWAYYARPKGDLQLLFICKKPFKNEYHGIIDTKLKYFQRAYEIQHIWKCDNRNFDKILSFCGLYLITTKSFKNNDNIFDVKIKVNVQNEM